MSDLKVDYIFPWVNPEDVAWQRSYKINSGSDNFDVSRFRDFNKLKYVLRGIQYNMPWINNVYIILATKSQIPDWLNTEKIKVIYHKNFIPAQFLPTFNSNTIEVFLPLINTLSDNIIYGNDDTFVIRKTDITDFFTEDGIPKIAYSNVVPRKKTPFVENVYRCSNLIRPCAYIKQVHQNVAWNKSSLRAVFKEHQNEILGSVTKFRDFKINYSQYIFTDYQVLEGKHVKVPNNGFYCDYIDEKTFKTLEDPKYKQVCFNDNNNFSFEDLCRIEDYLHEILPVKSKFEK